MRAPNLTGALRSNMVGEVALRLPQLVFDGLAARLLIPSEFGVLTGFRMLLQLTPYLPSIATSGLDLRYSGLIGAGDAISARQVAGTAWLLVLLATAAQLLALGVGLGSPVLREALSPGASREQYGFILVAVATQGVYVFLVSHLRNQLKFTAVNSALLVGNAIALFVLVLMISRLRVTAAIIAYALSMLVAVALWSRRVDLEMPMRSVFQREGWFLLQLGGPLLLIGFAFDSVRLLTRWVVGQQFGTEGLGFLGVAYMVSGVVYLMGTSASRVMVQFMARAEGERITHEEQIRHFFMAPALGVLSIVAGATITIYLASQVLLPLWAPAQAGALPLLRPALYGAMLLTMSFLYMTLFRAQQRFRLLAVSTFAAFLILGGFLCGVYVLRLDLYWYVISEAASFSLLLALLSVMTHRTVSINQRPFILTTFAVIGMTAFGLELGSYLAERTATNRFCALSIECAASLGTAIFWVPLVFRTRRALNGVAKGEGLNMSTTTA
jgi:O-antigen/teichoic acid export membrane protein